MVKNFDRLNQFSKQPFVHIFWPVVPTNYVQIWTNSVLSLLCYPTQRPKHIYRQTFFKPLFWDQRTLKRIVLLKSLFSCDHITFSMGEKLKNTLPSRFNPSRCKNYIQLLNVVNSSYWEEQNVWNNISDIGFFKRAWIKSCVKRRFLIKAEIRLFPIKSLSTFKLSRSSWALVLWIYFVYK